MNFCFRALTSRIRAAGSVTLVAGTAMVFTALASGGCSADIFDVSVELMPEAFTVDFGASSGTIPTVVCDPQDTSASACGGAIQVGDGTGQATLRLGCDAASARCFGQADAAMNTTVDVLRDEAFTSKVGRKAVSLVRMLDIAVTVPTNTMTFDVPRIDVYVGPPGITLPGDAGVVFLDRLYPIAAGTTITSTTDARHLVVADGSPARDLIERSIKGKSPFVFVLALAPRLDSGAPIPAGTLTVNLQPLLGLGCR